MGIGCIRASIAAVRLLTRTGLDWTHKYPAVADAVSSIGARQPYSMASCAACATTA
jgi:hypothetical protein